jgi:hypothetical protein
MAGCPSIAETSFGRITIGGETYDHDVYVLADGAVKKRKKKLAKAAYGTSHKIGPDELRRLCKHGPEVVFIGTGQYGVAELTPEGEAYLRGHVAEWHVLPTPQLAEAYNACDSPKAALIHVTC